MHVQFKLRDIITENESSKFSTMSTYPFIQIRRLIRLLRTSTKNSCGFSFSRIFKQKKIFYFAKAHNANKNIQHAS